MGNQKSSSLPPQLVEELEQITSFSYAEINDLYRQFRSDCPDQRMTVIQFRQLYRNTFPNGNPDKFAEHVFETFDKDQKGSIDFRQFLTTLGTQLKGGFEQKLEWLFELYDSDHVGYISSEGLLEMIKAVQDLHAGALPTEKQYSAEEVVGHIMKQTGAEAKGRLSKADFIKAAMTSNTLAAILQGTIKAADSPYLRRKQRRGSLGIPLHHVPKSEHNRHLEPGAYNSGERRRSSGAGSHGSGSSGGEPSGAHLGVPNQAGDMRRPSLTPEMLDFNSFVKH